MSQEEDHPILDEENRNRMVVRNDPAGEQVPARPQDDPGVIEGEHEPENAPEREVHEDPGGEADVPRGLNRNDDLMVRKIF